MSSHSWMTGGDDPKPLSDREVQQLKRLLSDPFNYPPELWNWIKGKMEDDPPGLTWEAILGFGNAVRAAVVFPSGVPVGAMIPYLGASDPGEGWMLADGRLLDRTTYADLFAVVGFSYSPTPGTDPGSNQFYAPDGRSRLFAGIGTHADMTTRGKNEGMTIANRTIRHRHTHSIAFTGAYTETGTESHDHQHYTSGNTGYMSGSQSHNHPPAAGNSDFWGGSGSGVWIAGGGTFLINSPGGTGYANIDHYHSWGNWSGYRNQAHYHGLTPNGSISGIVGASAAHPLDAPAHLLGNWIFYTGVTE